MKYIAIEEFCNYHGIEVTLVQEFADFGLVQVHVQDNQQFVPDTDIAELERMLRLSRDLGVNKEGIEIILNMRQELKRLRRQKQKLNYRLQQLEAEKQQQLYHLYPMPGALLLIIPDSE